MPEHTLIIVTEHFPYGGGTEEVFVSPELDSLSRRFDRVVLMPCVKRGPKSDLAEYNNIEVSDCLIRAFDNRVKLARLRHLWIPVVLRNIFPLSSLKYALAAMSVRSALRRFIRKNVSGEMLVYSFWFDYPATGIAFLKGVRGVARAHRYDIYMQRARSLRKEGASRLLKIFAVSGPGADYLRSTGFEADMEVRHLGSLNRGILASHHRKSDKCLTFLSCSRVVAPKRVDSNLKLMQALAIARPDTLIRWIHLGDGEGFRHLQAEAEADRTPNLEIQLRGDVSNREVHSVYETHKIDWMMLLSESEGIPIAICEAFSYGVPVVATMVGGIEEIVDDDCGLLLASDFTPEEFVRGIAPYLDSESRYAAMSVAARRKWENGYDAASTRESFAEELLSLCSSQTE